MTSGPPVDDFRGKIRSLEREAKTISLGDDQNDDLEPAAGSGVCMGPGLGGDQCNVRLRHSYGDRTLRERERERRKQWGGNK